MELKKDLKIWRSKQENIENQLELITPNMITMKRFSSFSSKRSAIHNRMSSKLIEFANVLKDKQKKVIDDLGVASGQMVNRVGVLNYDNNHFNMMKRELTFISRKIQRLHIKKMNYEIYYCIYKREQVKHLLIKFSNNSTLIPADVAYRIPESFFNMEPSDSFKRNDFKLRAFRHKYQEIKDCLDKQPISPWFTNFTSNLFDSVKNYAQRLDKMNSYSLPFPFEESISRAVFCQKTNEQMMIDDLIIKMNEMKNDSFVKESIELCSKLTPHREMMTSEEQNLSLIIFYRILFDRIYEKKFKSLFLTNQCDAQKIFDISRVPLKYFTIPRFFEISSDDWEKPISDFFTSDLTLKSAIEFINDSMFYNNPIDVLYCIHRSLLMIHKAGILQGIKTVQATQEDITKLLCFDDFFSLLVGVAVSSSLPDVLSLANFLEVYSPKFCLSNSFEYAEAGIIALATHLKNITADSLISQNIRK